MKKSSFVALILGVISGMLFSLGMCMVLLPEWNAFTAGLIFGGAGLVLGVLTILLWRRLTHKAPLHISARAVGAVALGGGGALLLGVGMCFCIVWSNMVIGILLGVVGILLLLGLIPFVKGFVD